MCGGKPQSGLAEFKIPNFRSQKSNAGETPALAGFD
jgi:hypothetical protein